MEQVIIDVVTFWPTHRVFYYDDGTNETISIDPAEVAETEAANAALLNRVNLIETVTQELEIAKALVALSPFPTPEEQVVIDEQIRDALALYATVTDPPVELTALAGAVGGLNANQG
jgi:hypothetical protein